MLSLGYQKLAKHAKNWFKKDQVNSIRGHEDKLPKQTELKNYNLFIAKLYAGIGKTNIANRVRECSQLMRFISDDTKKDKMCYLRNACHNRFCPSCQYAKARKFTRILATILKYLMDKATKAGNPIYSFLFVTPTIPDAQPIYTKDGKHLDEIKTGKEYRATVDIMNKSVTTLLHLPALNGVSSNGRVLGSMVKAEATIKRILSLNAHDHLILAMHGSYFHGKYYLTHDKWIKLWDKAVLTVCKQCLSPNRRDKFSQPWHKYVAKNLSKSIHKLISDGKGGLNIYVEPLYWKKMTTWVHGNKTYKRVKKVKLNKKNAKKVAPHAAAEVSKYETKAQDFKSLIKHGVSKNKVFGIFKAITMAYKGIHSLKFFGVFAKALKEYKNGDLDKYTESYQKDITYSQKMRAKFHNNKKKIYRYYSTHYEHMNDFDKIYFRKKLHVKTPYTTDEKHGNFHSKHDKKVSDIITGKLASKKATKDFKKQARELGILHVCWRDSVIYKLWSSRNDYYKYLGYDDDRANLMGARKVSYMLTEPKVWNWVYYPNKVQRHDFRLYLIGKNNGKFPSDYPSSKSFKEVLFDGIRRMYYENEEIKVENKLEAKRAHKQVLVKHVTNTPFGPYAQYKTEEYSYSLNLVGTDNFGRSVYQEADDNHSI